VNSLPFADLFEKNKFEKSEYDGLVNICREIIKNIWLRKR